MRFREAVGNGRWPEILAWTALCGFLLLCLPLFLCLPLWADVTLYDLAARSVLRGGVHYRDIFDTNLPGMLWLHLAIRSVLGWRSETIRAVDVVVVAAILCLLVRWVRRDGLPRGWLVWTALALGAFYLSTAESSHCQRDVWMLLPALGALHLRNRQMVRLSTAGASSTRVWTGALAEGICWALACWIKPHAAGPALACWLCSVVCIWRTTEIRWRLLALDAAGLLTGGLGVGALGVAWLLQTRAFPYFWEVFLDWNREYYAESTGFRRHTHDIFARFRPWSLVHYVALPLALVHLVRLARARATSRQGDKESGILGQVSWSPLFAVFYLSWLFQAAYLQKGHDYVLVPPMLLALTVVAERLGPLAGRPTVAVVLASLAVYLGVHHPLLKPHRLVLWGRCWQEQSTAQMRDHLKLTRVPFTVHWVELEQVADYLRRQQVRDGEVVCYNNFTHPLYLDLDLQPGTPFLHFDTLLTTFPHKRERIRQQLANSRQRFVVSDLEAVHVDGPLTEASDGSLCLPAQFPREHAVLFPWTEPILFRAGTYLVHQVTGPAGPLVAQPSGNLESARSKR
jgi:hypothetical protein